MNERDDELTPELRALLRRGIAPLEAPEGAAGRLSARLATTLAGDPTVGGGEAEALDKPLGWTRSTAAKWLVVAALGGAAAGSGITLATLRPPSSSPPPPSPPIPAAPRFPEDAGAVVGRDVDAAIDMSPEKLPTSASGAPKPAWPPDAGRIDTTAKERALLDTARAAYGRGDLSDAYRALELHGSSYPAGVLAEEREALAVRTLAGLGRADEARARARRFEATYPDSVMLPVVRGSTTPRDAGDHDANL